MEKFQRFTYDFESHGFSVMNMIHYSIFNVKKFPKRRLRLNSAQFEVKLHTGAELGNTNKMCKSMPDNNDLRGKGSKVPKFAKLQKLPKGTKVSWVQMFPKLPKFTIQPKFQRLKKIINMK